MSKIVLSRPAIIAVAIVLAMATGSMLFVASKADATPSHGKQPPIREKLP